MKKQTLSSKIGLVNGIIICIALIAMLLIVELIYADIITSKEKQMMETYLTNSMNVLDDKLMDMGRVSLVCFSDEKAHQILEQYKGYDYQQQLDSEKYLHQFYTSMISIRNDVKGVYIFDKNDLIFFQDSQATSTKKKYPLSKYMKQLEKLSGQKGEVSGCYLQVEKPLEFMHYIQGNEKEKYFYLMRSVKSFSPFETIGYIVLSTPEKTFRQLLNKNLENTMFFYLMSEKGGIVSRGGDDGGKVSREEIEKELKNHNMEEQGNFWIRTEQGKYLITFQKSDYSKMTLVTGKPVIEIYAGVIKSVIYSFVILSVLSFITIFIVRRYTKKRLHPLEEMSYTMSNFDVEDMNFRFQVKTQDETGKLMDSFNRMQDIIRDLIEEEYKSKERLQEAQIRQQQSSLLYLKNQINPHFLYNTLDNIRIRAELNGDKEVGYMILQLVQFFRLNVKADRQWVTISHEVRLIQAYMNLMCYRYEALKYEVCMDKELEEIRIPNFLLQPLVENGLMHGLRDKGYKGIIRLSVESDVKRVGYIYIRIYDNGVGLTKESSNRLRKMLETYQSDDWKKEEETHIGVLNVQKRLKMYYPEECGLTYMENPEGGVTAVILIKKEPKEKWEENL